MTEIFRVLFVTLLLNGYWPPSGDATEGDQYFEYSPGEKQIATILDSYTYGCNTDRTTGPDYTPGQVYIIELLSNYSSRGCKVGGEFKKIPTSINITAGERQIFNLLSHFVTFGCHGAGRAGTILEAEANFSDFTPGETGIIKSLLSYFLSGCRKHHWGKSGDGNKTTPDAEFGKSKDGNRAAGRNLQSAVLQLFLLILGVFF